MTDPAALLAAALPEDPTDHGPIAVPTDAVRAVVVEVQKHRIAHDALIGVFGDGGLLLEIDRIRQLEAMAEPILELNPAEPIPDGGA